MMIGARLDLPSGKTESRDSSVLETEAHVSKKIKKKKKKQQYLRALKHRQKGGCNKSSPEFNSVLGSSRAAK
jgi:hypothetical protein